MNLCINVKFHIVFQQREGEKGFVIKTAKNRRGLYHLMSETVNPSMLRK